jgi:lysophospholipase L1-like esterase
MCIKKITAYICILCVLAYSKPDFSSVFFNDSSKKILFLGDSITWNGAYITKLIAMLEERYPDLAVQIQRDPCVAGRPGETLSGLGQGAGDPLICNGNPGRLLWLFSRLDQVLDSEKPDLVIAAYGMNDGNYRPYSSEVESAYRTGVQRLIRKMDSLSIDLMLVSPSPYDALARGRIRTLYDEGDALCCDVFNQYRGYDETLKQFRDYLLEIEEDSLPVVDIHTPHTHFLEEQRKTNPNYALAQDGIHPGDKGHEISAQAIFDKIIAVAERDSIQAVRDSLTADSIATSVTTNVAPSGLMVQKFVGGYRIESSGVIYDARISNIQGDIVARPRVSQAYGRWSVKWEFENTLIDGLYLIQIKGSQGVQTLKLVVD